LHLFEKNYQMIVCIRWLMIWNNWTSMIIDQYCWAITFLIKIMYQNTIIHKIYIMYNWRKQLKHKICNIFPALRIFYVLFSIILKHFELNEPSFDFKSITKLDIMRHALSAIIFIIKDSFVCIGVNILPCYIQLWKKGGEVNIFLEDYLFLFLSIICNIMHK